MSSGLGYPRAHLQALSLARLTDAQILLANARFSASYYIGGYAVELALKASISRQFRAETLPDPKLVSKVYVHQFGELVNLAGLAGKLKDEQKISPEFAANWAIVSQWSESARYEEWDTFTATQFLMAVNDETAGVHRWLRLFW